MKEQNREILELIIRPTLMELDMYSPEAETLIFATGLVESGYREIEQGIGERGGPALGYFQMEESTYFDIWKNYIDYRPELEARIVNVCNLGRIPKPEAMLWHNRLACCMARIHYYRVPDKIPTNIEGMAKYWKKNYNTAGGKGTQAKFLQAWSNR